MSYYADRKREGGDMTLPEANITAAGIIRQYVRKSGSGRHWLQTDRTAAGTLEKKETFSFSISSDDGRRKFIRAACSQHDTTHVTQKHSEDMKNVSVFMCGVQKQCQAWNLPASFEIDKYLFEKKDTWKYFPTRRWCILSVSLSHL